MAYVLAEITLYLVIAGLIGFIVGWLVKGELQKRLSAHAEAISVEELIQRSEKIISENDEKLANEKNIDSSEQETASKEESSQESQEVLTDDSKEEKISSLPPTLLSEAKAEGKDSLSTIKGIGPVLEKKLNELGIYHFEQIASWTHEEEEWVGSQISFPKKVRKEAWVEQAKELMNKK